MKDERVLQQTAREKVEQISPWFLREESKTKKKLLEPFEGALETVEKEVVGRELSVESPVQPIGHDEGK